MGFLDIMSYGQYVVPFDLQSFVTFSVFTIVVGSLYWYLTMPKNLPPGPLGVPILGSLPFLGKQSQFTLSEMAKKYGQVFSLYLGSQLVIVLNDYDAMKDALIKQSDKFWSRPLENHFQFPEVRGEMPADDDTIWKTHRRFAMKTLRDFGMGKDVLEGKIMEEIKYFLKEFEKKAGKALNPKYEIDVSVANNICSIMFGKRFEYDDPSFLGIKKAQDEAVAAGGTLSFFVFLPWTRYIPGLDFFLQRNKVAKNLKTFHDFARKEWISHSKSFDINDANDYTSAFIAEKNNLNDNNQSDVLFHENVYCDQAQVLFFAGMETTATMLKWNFIYMINYPKIQKKIQEEIDRVIGKDRKPQWSDRLRTPYVEAFLMEIHRIVTLVPLNAPHSNVVDAVLRGYHIPKRSTIISNMWNVHHDPKYWEKPDEFKPERFLNKDNQIVKHECFIPFSIGKHACLGEGLAKMEEYLYFTSLVQRFTFEAELGHLPSMKTTSSGLVNTPLPFKIIAKRR